MRIVACAADVIESTRTHLAVAHRLRTGRRERRAICAPERWRSVVAWVAVFDGQRSGRTRFSVATTARLPRRAHRSGGARIASARLRSGATGDRGPPEALQGGTSTQRSSSLCSQPAPGKASSTVAASMPRVRSQAATRPSRSRIARTSRASTGGLPRSPSSRSSGRTVIGGPGPPGPAAYRVTGSRRCGWPRSARWAGAPGRWLGMPRAYGPFAVASHPILRGPREETRRPLPATHTTAPRTEWWPIERGAWRATGPRRFGRALQRASVLRDRRLDAWRTGVVRDARPCSMS